MRMRAGLFLTNKSSANFARGSQTDLDARADLSEIVAHISRDNPRAALEVGEGLLPHAKVLETFPLIGPLFRNTSLPGVRRIVAGDYLIIDRTNTAAKEVEILSLWHAAPGHPDFL